MGLGMSHVPWCSVILKVIEGALISNNSLFLYGPVLFESLPLCCIFDISMCSLVQKDFFRTEQF